MDKKRELVYGQNTILEHGYGIVAKVAMTDRTLSPTAKALYAYLCTYADNHNRAFPSLEKIKADLNLGKNTLYKYMRELRKAGYITVSQSRDNSGKWSRNVYSIALIPQRTPYPKKRDTVNWDTVDDASSRENETFAQNNPYPKQRDTVNWDTDSGNFRRQNPVDSGTKITNDLKVPIRLPREEAINALDASPRERLILSVLKEIYPSLFDYAKDLLFIRGLAVDFPTVNLLDEAKNWQTWLMDRGRKGPKNMRLAFRNWCRKAEEIAHKKGGTKNAQAQRNPAQRSKYADLVIS